MSMCYIGWRAGGHRGVSHAHYSLGQLDHSKYHAEVQRSLAKHALSFKAGSSLRAYFEEVAFDHSQKKLRFRPDLNVGGCERMADEAGCWRCDTPKEQAAWRRMIRGINPTEDIPAERCSLFLDFTNKHATVRGVDERWIASLPDGWSHEAKLIKGFVD